MHSHGRDLHDVADVEQVEPLGLIEVPEDCLHVQPRLSLVEADRLKLLIPTSAIQGF
jgi:hypothetical protein